jgi:hypothetical protein
MYSSERKVMRHIPSKDDVLMFGSNHNPNNWKKYKRLIRDDRAFDRVLSAAQSKPKFTRGQVFNLAKANPAQGAIGSVVWGFPRGSRPGGAYQSFASAFDQIDKFVDALVALKGKHLPASECLQTMNTLHVGIGFATTTKMLYFASIEFGEGPALIYDANVIRALQDDQGKWSVDFPLTRAAFGSGFAYSKAVRSYGSFIQEAKELAARESVLRNELVEPVQIETALFLEKAKAGLWS